MKSLLHLFALPLVVATVACAPASEPDPEPSSLMEDTAIATSDVQPLDEWMGTWKVNFDLSTYDPPRAPRPNDSVTTILTPWEGGHKAISDGTNLQGEPTHSEAISKFDGEEHEVVGASVPTTRTYTRIDSRTYEFVAKVNGEETTTSRSEVAADGMTRTLTTTGSTAEGEPVNRVVVYERQ